ncbi:MAG: HAD family hydrolase, partial [Actinomycetota bacterium]
MAKSIVKLALDRGLMVPDASEFESVRGFGTRAHVAGRVVAVGNERFVANHRGFPSVKTVIDEMAGRGGSIVAVTSGDEMVGVIGVMNRIREEAKDAVADLRKLGIEHMILLTGDHAAAARAIADQAGVRDLKSDLLPTDKVNDSPALARSALGIAMGGAGSPAAIETADVVLM